MDNILTIAKFAKKLGVPKEYIDSKSRENRHKIPRQLYWLYLRKRGLDKRMIARIFDLSHSTISSGIKTISNLIETKDPILSQYKDFIYSFLNLPHSN